MKKSQANFMNLNCKQQISEYKNNIFSIKMPYLLNKKNFKPPGYKVIDLSEMAKASTELPTGSSEMVKASAKDILD